MSNPIYEPSEPIHNWFSLTYANYLVLRRSVLQSAPVDLQQRLVVILNELHDLFGDEPLEGAFTVQLRNDQGRFVVDPFADYERGRRRIQMAKERSR